MAFAYLNPQGRIWQANGLKYLLFPQDLPCGEGLCSLSTLKTSDPQNKTFTAQPPPSARPLFRKKEDSIAEPAQVRTRPSHKRSVPAESNSSALGESSSEEAVAANRTQRNSSAKRVIPSEAWPQIWQQQLSRTKKALFAWTYMDLGADLFFTSQKQEEGKVDPAYARRKLRSQCLRKLLTDLSHPQGTHTFWPIALPQKEDGTYLANTDCFWSGLDSLGCRGVIFMGKSAASAALGTDDLKPLSHLFKNGKLVWILWEPDEIARNPIVYDSVLPFLRRSLGQFVRN